MKELTHWWNLIEIAEDIAQNNPLIVTKTLIPSVIKLLDENKAEIKFSIQKLLTALHSVMKNKLFEGIPTNKVKLVKDALGV